MSASAASNCFRALLPVKTLSCRFSSEKSFKKWQKVRLFCGDMNKWRLRERDATWRNFYLFDDPCSVLSPRTRSYQRNIASIFYVASPVVFHPLEDFFWSKGMVRLYIKSNWWDGIAAQWSRLVPIFGKKKSTVTKVWKVTKWGNTFEIAFLFFGYPPKILTPAFIHSW